MANRVYIQYTTFQNIDSNANPTGEIRFGYRLYDDYEGVYNNCFETIEDLKAKGPTEGNIVKFIGENHPQFYETVCERGIHFNDHYLPPNREND